MREPNTPVEIRTLRDHAAWSYANLARALAARTEGSSRYTRTHHIIRSRLFAGLKSGRMTMRSLYDDERLKLTSTPLCAYCGASASLVADHLVPRVRGGADEGDSPVRACRSCNSSKGGRDLLEWCRRLNTFPSLLILRRYLKLVARHCDREGLLDMALDDPRLHVLPFPLLLLPHEFPPLTALALEARGRLPATPLPAPSA